MKTNKTIVSKISIASIAFMMLAGFSVSQAAEKQHAKGDADKGSRNHRNDRIEPQHQDGRPMGRGMRGGPRVENHQSKGFPFQRRRMDRRASSSQSDQQNQYMREERGSRQTDNQRIHRRASGAYGQRAMRGQHPGNPRIQAFRRPWPLFQNRGNTGSTQMRGRMMAQRSLGNMPKQRLGRVMAMRQMALRFRGEGAGPFMGGRDFREIRRGADGGQGRSHFQQNPHHDKGKGRHQELRGRKAKDTQSGAMKTCDHGKDRAAKNKKGIQNRRGDKKGGKGERRSHRGNRNRRS